jgi:tetratricopeptide (TPR) repeat protein
MKVLAVTVLTAGLAAAAAVALRLMPADRPLQPAPSAVGTEAVAALLSWPAKTGGAGKSAEAEAAPPTHADLDRAIADNDCGAIVPILDDLWEGEAGGPPSWRKDDVKALMGCMWSVESDDSSERLLSAAFEVDPTHPLAATDLAWLLRGQQRYTEALAVLDRALALQDTPIFLARRSALLLSIVTTGGVPEDQAEARWEEAGNGLVSAVERDPTLGPSVYEATVPWLGEPDHYARGVPILERILAAMLVDPHNIGLTSAELASMYLRLSDLLARNGQAESAMAYLDQAAALAVEPEDRARIASQRLELIRLASGPGGAP